MKKKSKSKGTVSIVLVLALVALVGYFTISSIKLRIERNNRATEVASLSAEAFAEDEKNSELANVLNSENESEYIEQYAREKLDYVMPGERVYADSAG